MKDTNRSDKGESFSRFVKSVVAVEVTEGEGLAERLPKFRRLHQSGCRLVVVIGLSFVLLLA